MNVNKLIKKQSALIEELERRVESLEAFCGDMPISNPEPDKFDLSAFIKKDRLDLDAIDKLPLADGYALLQEGVKKLQGFYETARKERDNYYDRLQELRAEKADVQNMHEPKLIEVPCKINEFGVVVMKSSQYEFSAVYSYCDENDIDQKRIKRIWLEMKAEGE